ncbi:hypothetical protein E2N92_01630 [Methanofollis formosanus]|uniref:Uncharacterized protein n=1 Tax=Methanofollis formosanus TaxID=299308 RepID=A0A8G1A0K7_9EURY|nr:hypothetical protein [Methanofollis formosanus]QYZ78221.1 hypothetical protein E2N92_01630 [Methanofollis formosanus]
MINQIIYTSCKTGIHDRNAGFQVLSYSAKLDLTDMGELESLLSGYRAPIDRPNNPTPQEIKTLFPQAFLFTTLSSGKYCIGLSTYLGHDYMGESGRSGNFMSHFLVIDKSEFNQYPCSLYSSPTFRERLEFDEVNQPKKPDFLPEIPNLQPGEILDINSIMEFIGNDREEIYLAMIAAVLEYNNPENTSKKKILILDEGANIAKWIAAIHFAFPVRNLDTIPFCTYTYSPGSTNFLINGVLPTGTSFIPDSADNIRYFHVFDCLNHVWPELPTDEGFFKLLGLSLTLSYKNLEHFQEFLSDYQYTKADKELHDAFYLYEIVNSQEREMKKEKISGAVNFDSKYGTGKTRIGLFNGLLSARNVIIHEYDLASKQELCKLLIRTAIESDDNTTYSSQAYTFFIDMLLSTLDTAGSDEIYRTIWSVYNDILAFDKTLNGSLINHLTSLDRIDDLISKLTGSKKVFPNAFFLSWALIGIDEKHATMDDLKKTDGYSRLIDRIFENVGQMSSDSASHCMTITITTLKNRQIFLSIISRIMSYFSENNELKIYTWRMYTDVMQNADNVGYDRAYDYFLSHKQTDLMYLLYQYQYDRSLVKKEVFLHHVYRYVNGNTDYSWQYSGKIFSRRIDSINSTSKQPEKIHELKETVDLIYTMIADANLKRDLVLHVCSILPISKPDRDSLTFINTLYNGNNDLNQSDVSPKFYLIDVGRVIERERESGELAQRFKERLGLLSVPHIGDISKEDKMDFLNWILPNLVWYMRSKEDYRDLFRIVGDFIQDNVAFETKFLEELDHVVTHGFDNQPISSFIEYCADSNRDFHSPFGQYIIDTLYSLSDSKRDMLFKEMHRVEQNNDQLKKYLKLISDTIREREESTLLGRFKKILKKSAL